MFEVMQDEKNIDQGRQRGVDGTQVQKYLRCVAGRPGERLMKALWKAMSVDTNTNCTKDWPITSRRLSASCQRLQKQNKKQIPEGSFSFRKRPARKCEVCRK